jgi:hypothetical protein
MTLAAFLPVFVLALTVIGLAVAAMAIGVMFRRPCLRGSCGGPAAIGADSSKLSCSSCPNRRRTEHAASSSTPPPAG